MPPNLRSKRSDVDQNTQIARIDPHDEMETRMPPKFTNANEPGRGYHDIGGLDYGAVDPITTEVAPWEKLSIAIGNAIGGQGRKLINTDMGRRAREGMGEELYNELDYFERTTESMKITLIEQGLFTQEELEERMKEIEGRLSEVRGS